MKDPETDTIEFYLRSIVHSIELKQNRELLACGITVQQGRALGMIAKLSATGITPSQRDLQDRLGLKGPSITNLLQTLEKKGLITRESGHLDNRIKYLALTKSGRTLIERMYSVLQETTNIFHESISHEEKEILENILRKVYERLSDDPSG